jgi:hypothetical protein
MSPHRAPLGLLAALALSGCSHQGGTMPDDVPGDPRLGACVAPDGGWADEATAKAATNLQELVITGTVSQLGTGPAPCFVQGDWALWQPSETDPTAAAWVQIEDAGGKKWDVGVRGKVVSLTQVLSAGDTLTVHDRVYYPGGRDDLPRGQIQLDDATGLLLWAGRHGEPSHATPPDPFTWSDEGETEHYATKCGPWSERTMRVGFPTGNAVLTRGQGATPPGFTVTSGGWSKIDDTSAWGCMDVVKQFGAELWIERTP